MVTRSGNGRVLDDVPMRISAKKSLLQLAALLVGVFFVADICVGWPKNELDTKPYSSRVSESPEQFIERLASVASEPTFATVPAKMEGAFHIRLKRHELKDGFSYELLRPAGWDLRVVIFGLAARPGVIVDLGAILRPLSFGKRNGDCVTIANLRSRLDQDGWKYYEMGAGEFPMQYGWTSARGNIEAIPLYSDSRHAFCVDEIRLFFKN